MRAPRASSRSGATTRSTARRPSRRPPRSRRAESRSRCWRCPASTRGRSPPAHSPLDCPGWPDGLGMLDPTPPPKADAVALAGPVRRTAPARSITTVNEDRRCLRAQLAGKPRSGAKADRNPVRKTRGCPHPPPPLPRRIMASQPQPGTAQPHHGRYQPLPLPGRSHPDTLASHRIATTRQTTRDLRSLDPPSRSFPECVVTAEVPFDLGGWGWCRSGGHDGVHGAVAGHAGCAGAAAGPGVGQHDLRPVVQAFTEFLAQGQGSPRRR